MAPSRKGRVLATLAIAYVAAVLTIDCLATQGVRWGIDWSLFRRIDVHPIPYPGGVFQTYGADYFKLAAWFVIPAAFAAWRFPSRWVTTGAWKPIDRWLLAGMFVLGAGAVASVHFIPGLRNMYPSLAELPIETRMVYLGWYLVWLATWLPGWELMHRYVLVRAAEAFGKAARPLALAGIPLFEAAYHVGQGKAWIECAGVAVFSVLCTAWTLRRRNILLPVLAHAFIEIGLIAFMLFV